MNLNVAYQDWTHSRINSSNAFADVMNSFQEMKDMRMQNPITAKVKPLETCSLDAEKLACTYREHQLQHKTLKEHYDSMVKRREEMNHLYTQMVTQASLLNQVYDKFPQVDPGDKQETIDSFRQYEAHCKNLTDNIIHALDKELQEYVSQLDILEANMACMRKCINLGMELMVKDKDINRNTCPVCYDADVNMVLIPCGHTACSQCIDNLRDCKCMACNQWFTSKHKIYFS